MRTFVEQSCNNFCSIVDKLAKYFIGISPELHCSTTIIRIFKKCIHDDFCLTYFTEQYLERDLFPWKQVLINLNKLILL